MKVDLTLRDIGRLYGLLILSTTQGLIGAVDENDTIFKDDIVLLEKLSKAIQSIEEKK